jgi:hypothetical protein
MCSPPAARSVTARRALTPSPRAGTGLTGHGDQTAEAADNAAMRRPRHRVKPARSEPTYLLVSPDKEYTATQPGEPWETYYAQRILGHFSPPGR